jgi:nitrite reductase (NO-forming)
VTRRIAAPIGNRGPRRVKVDLETIEVTGNLADGATYRYWTFNQKVPGPFIRVRVGDTVEVRLKNHDDSVMMHNVDFHAVTGPGGGAKATDAAPGESRGFEFTAINPGLFVYLCAVPMAAQHIANGMYGMILVEPEGGLPRVDHEFYVMQGEIYTEQKLGSKGELTESYDKLLAERPEYFVFNGAALALAKEKPLKAKTGETVRIFFGVGGPNYTWSFHVIGEVFERVYNLGSLTTSPMRDVQTTTVPPGGATVVDIKLEVPGASSCWSTMRSAVSSVVLPVSWKSAARTIRTSTRITTPRNPQNRCPIERRFLQRKRSASRKRGRPCFSPR